MRLVVRQGVTAVGDYEFADGPIRIGRRSDNHICLPNGKVSKHHAVILNIEEDGWIAKDLDSANKTYLNGQAIYKAKIKTGDCLRISDFTIEINSGADNETIDLAVDDMIIGEITSLGTIADETAASVGRAGKTAAPQAVAEKTTEDEPAAKKPPKSAKKIAALLANAQIIARKLNAEKPSPIRFEGERAVDFLKVAEAISKADSTENVLQALLDIIAKQFKAYQVWATLRNKPDGPMTANAGKQRNGKPLELDDITLSPKIDESIAEGEFLLFVFSREPEQDDRTQVRSVLIAPIISPDGCLGALYVNNTFIDDHYNLGKLDYLMFIAMHAATVLQKF